MTKFANDIKLFRVLETQMDCEALQKALSKLGEWATKLQTLGSVNKCKVQQQKNPLMGSEVSESN